jgi:CRP-like cAMP-binding protein
MSVKTIMQPANNLINSLPRKIHNQILDKATIVNLQIGEIVWESGEFFKHIYFPLTGFISLIAAPIDNNNKSLEMNLIGNEGMLGSTILLGIKTAPMTAIVQGSGTFLEISVSEFQRILLNSSKLRRLCNRYLYVQIIQLTQNAVCIQFHSIESRLARWLLMTQDRAHSDNIRLTHVFLSYMLGVRRSSITNAASKLKHRNLIKYNRGKMTVINRKGLKSASCKCYEAQIKVYLAWLA